MTHTPGAPLSAGTARQITVYLFPPPFPGGALNVGDGQVLAGPTEPRRMTSGWSFRQLMWIPRIWLARA